jgi:ABC-type bacteriocin/lantibiotic exporter with double-glycine peptidase domain
MYAINSYLDLGAGVLILWYGGNLAMGNGEGEGGGLTPGQLITFQLYWTLINSAYKGLIDILTSFTRSAGAASRIFSLMDALPDIDPDSGTPLSREQIFGGIEFRGVGFRYQMRPDLKVLEGVQLLIRPGTTCQSHSPFSLSNERRQALW